MLWSNFAQAMGRLTALRTKDREPQFRDGFDKVRQQCHQLFVVRHQMTCSICSAITHLLSGSSLCACKWAGFPKRGWPQLDYCYTGWVKKGKLFNHKRKNATKSSKTMLSHRNLFYLRARVPKQPGTRDCEAISDT